MTIKLHFIVMLKICPELGMKHFHNKARGFKLNVQQLLL